MRFFKNLAELLGLLVPLAAWAVWYCILCPPAHAAVPPRVFAGLDDWRAVGAELAPLWLILLVLVALLVVEAVRPHPSLFRDPFDGPRLRERPDDERRDVR